MTEDTASKLDVTIKGHKKSRTRVGSSLEGRKEGRVVKLVGKPLPG